MSDNTSYQPTTCSLATALSELEPTNQPFLDLDARYDNLVADLQQARAEAAQARLAYRADKEERTESRMQTEQVRQQSQALRYELSDLHSKLTIKQGVITLLLPYYPYPLTPMLQYAISL